MLWFFVYWRCSCLFWFAWDLLWLLRLVVDRFTVVWVMLHVLMVLVVNTSTFVVWGVLALFDCFCLCR